MYSGIEERKIFWFEKGRNGNPVIVKPDGTKNWIKNDTGKYNSERDKHAYRRANLVMEEYGIWDVTAFAALMQAVIAFKDPREENSFFAFSSIQDAEKHVNPYINSNDIRLCKKYVDEFYDDANLQAGWTGIILHPVCIQIKLKDGKISKIPKKIKDIANNYSFLEVMNTDDCSFITINSLDDEDILFSLNREYFR